MVAMKSLLSWSRWVSSSFLRASSSLYWMLRTTSATWSLSARRVGTAASGTALVGAVQQADGAQQLVLGLQRRREEAAEPVLLHRLEQAADLRVGDRLVALGAGRRRRPRCRGPCSCGLQSEVTVADERALLEVAACCG